MTCDYRAAVTSRWIAPLLLVLVSASLLVSSSACHRKRELPSPPIPKAPVYRPAPPDTQFGKVEGRLTRAGSPVAGVVYLREPRPGRPRPEPTARPFALTQAGFDRSAYLVLVGDRYVGNNHSENAHALRLLREGQRVLPMMLKKAARNRVLGTGTFGEFTLECSEHPHERAAIVVVNHPYATATDASGTFEWDDVPVGEVHIVAVLTPEVRVERTIHVGAGESVLVHLDAPPAQNAALDAAPTATEQGTVSP